MSDDSAPKPPPLPTSRRRIDAASAAPPPVVTPDYGGQMSVRPKPPAPSAEDTTQPATTASRQGRASKSVFAAYGGRMSQAVMAVRLPPVIETALKLYAVERGMQTPRVIYEAIYEYLKNNGRLPEPPAT